MCWHREEDSGKEQESLIYLAMALILSWLSLLPSQEWLAMRFSEWQMPTCCLSHRMKVSCVFYMGILASQGGLERLSSLPAAQCPDLGVHSTWPLSTSQPSSPGISTTTFCFWCPFTLDFSSATFCCPYLIHRELSHRYHAKWWQSSHLSLVLSLHSASLSTLKGTQSSMLHSTCSVREWEASLFLQTTLLSTSSSLRVLLLTWQRSWGLIERKKEKENLDNTIYLAEDLWIQRFPLTPSPCNSRTNVANS